MHFFTASVVAAFTYAVGSTAQISISSAPSGLVRIAPASDGNSCLGSTSNQVGAPITIATNNCRASEAHAKFFIIQGSSGSSAVGLKFEVTDSSSPVVCLSAGDGTNGAPLTWAECGDDSLQLFEYSQPINSIVPLFKSGSCITNNNGSITLAPCSAPAANAKQQWVFQDATFNN